MNYTSKGLEHGVDPKGEMHKLPAMIVGPYAEKDAELTLKLWQSLPGKKLLNKSSLMFLI